MHRCPSRFSIDTSHPCPHLSADYAIVAVAVIEETFALYFRSADSVAVRNHSRVPVALLRFAADLGKTHCSQRWGVASCGLAQGLLELPFKDRATFILVSILRVQPSAAAVALRLRRSQLAAHWIRSALRLRWFWLRTGELREAQSVA